MNINTYQNTNIHTKIQRQGRNGHKNLDADHSVNFVPLISKIRIKYFLIWKLHSLLLSWMHEGCSLSTGNNKSTCFRLWFSYFSRAFTFLRSCHVSFFVFYCGRPQLTENGIVWLSLWNGTLTPCSPSKIFWNSSSDAHQFLCYLKHRYI